ncbi:quinol monooxygenase YgiN [Neobacillus niacini]|uniref:putative quinol monooxygenase n=1 Tax=Neobacillus driksii TaxID=3035913 RepID=UPI00278A2D58|nr:putative quinol monooxygenase [Neobacillus niacini]MDQ0974569.1 quinol monooxygenase YgiN [Neobacillus niacini]
MEKFGIYGKLIAKEGEREQLAAILLEAAESLQNHADCELYLVSVAPEDPNAVYVYEVWSSESAHQGSLTLESTRTLIQRAKPFLAGMERISTLVPKGGKGI